MKSESIGRFCSLLCAIVCVGTAEAQITAADSAEGWRPLFNGKDFNDFYFNYANTGFVEPSKQNSFEIDSGMIHVPKPTATKNTKQGHVITKKEYSWYKVRVDYKFIVNGGSGEINAGLVIHIDNPKGQLAASGLRPTSIEVNMRRPQDAPWTLWSAMNLGPYLSSTVTSGNKYKDKAEGGTAWTNDPWGSRTLFSSYANPEKPMGEWNHGEAWVYGDSLGLFYLNGQLRTKAWDFKVRGPDGSADVAKRVPWTKGGIGLQGEMWEVWYKNFDIMELEPHTKRPIHASGPTTVLAPRPASRKGAGVRADRNSPSYNMAGRRLDSGRPAARILSLEVTK
jgi:hypothetical protein